MKSIVGPFQTFQLFKKWKHKHYVYKYTKTYLVTYGLMYELLFHSLSGFHEIYLIKTSTCCLGDNNYVQLYLYLMYLILTIQHQNYENFKDFVILTRAVLQASNVYEYQP
jgi:hypothetical protein